MRRYVTVGTGLRRLGVGVGVLVMAATGALVAPAAPAGAVGEFCTLDIIAPRRNAATNMVEALAMVTCNNLPSGVTVNRIDIGVFLLKGNSAQAAHMYGHSQPGNPFYGPVVAVAPCNSGDGKWRTAARAQVAFSAGTYDTNGGDNPLVELPPVAIKC